MTPSGISARSLKKAGLDKNTCVFFMSDNGATHEERADHRGRPYEGGSNRPYRGWKGSLFEGGIRVPALIAWPGSVRGGVVDQPLAAMDILPTFVRTSQPVDGVDLEGVAPGPLAVAGPYPVLGVRRPVRRPKGKWKLLTAHKPFLNGPLTQSDWLSDLSVDPGETRNVASDHPDIVASLRRDIESSSVEGIADARTHAIVTAREVLRRTCVPVAVER